MRPSARDVMRYYDGDLSPEEAARIERALEEDEAAREHLLAVEELGDSVRLWANQCSNAAPDLSQAVIQRILADRGPGRAISRLSRALPAAASLVALAAAVALFVANRRPASVDVRPAPILAHTGQPTPSQSPGAPDVAPVELAPISAISAPAVAIEAVDFGESHGSIFVVSSGSGDTPVVWLSEGPDISPGRTHL